LPELDYTETVADGKGLYWARISTSESLKAGTLIQFLGLIWTNQNFLKLYWNEVDNARYLPTGKTDWYEIIELATRHVADDLNIRQLIDYELQVKDINDLGRITALKALTLILLPMRTSETLVRLYEDFEEMYQKASKKRLKGIDTDQSETLSSSEKKPSVSNSVIRRT
jgi:hypothetical protein